MIQGYIYVKSLSTKFKFRTQQKFNDLEYVYFVMLCDATQNLFSNFQTSAHERELKYRERHDHVFFR